MQPASASRNEAKRCQGCRMCGSFLFLQGTRVTISGAWAASGKTLWGSRCPRCQTSESLPCLYPSGGRRGRENWRAWSCLHIEAITPDESQGHGPTRSVADVLYWDTCEKGFEGRHTPSWVSSDSYRRGELRGLKINVNGIQNPSAEGLLCLGGTVAD